MKRHLMPAAVATHLHRPMRFGKRMRGHELMLRMAQLALIVFLAVVGAKFLAQMLSQGIQGLIHLLS